ncbi:MAG: DUF2283 domain-containing protein [Chloroherpetonaceae bacterium]|nr:DUF2283 domain-containing protein [Chloroherpetonaceae bacterium]MDW8467603.1 DUF2283 domain-containing protein [Chloroherpetonaceae bacterium]
MSAKLIFKYDRTADILRIDAVPPDKEQETEELGNDIIARLNPNTDDIENLEILFFLARLLRSGLLEVPIKAEFYARNA